MLSRAYYYPLDLFTEIFIASVHMLHLWCCTNLFIQYQYHCKLGPYFYDLKFPLFPGVVSLIFLSLLHPFPVSSHPTVLLRNILVLNFIMSGIIKQRSFSTGFCGNYYMQYLFCLYYFHHFHVW